MRPGRRRGKTSVRGADVSIPGGTEAGMVAVTDDLSRPGEGPDGAHAVAERYGRDGPASGIATNGSLRA